VRKLGLQDVEFVKLDYQDKKEHKEPGYLKVTEILVLGTVTVCFKPHG
jgi:hypothetical protein